MDEDLVPGRECGGCTACCSTLAIDAPELRKAAGVTCPDCVAGQGCAIYETRPPVCREWFCGWRALDWVGDAMRPDRCDVLVYMTEEALPAGYAADIGLEFSILSPAGLQAEGLVDALCRSVRMGLPTYLNVPGPPGRRGARALVNNPQAGAPTPEAMRQDIVHFYANLRWDGPTGAGDAG
jgi:hypothetical protein